MVKVYKVAPNNLEDIGNVPLHYHEVILKSDYAELESENDLLKRSEICGYCDFDNSLRKERDALESENADLKESKNSWMQNCKFYQDKHDEFLNKIAELESKTELMNKNCISLFLHEQRMDQIDEQLKDYQQVVDKYADGYIFDEPDDDTDQDLQKPWRHTSGKLARAMQSKWGK